MSTLTMQCPSCKRLVVVKEGEAHVCQSIEGNPGMTVTIAVSNGPGTVEFLRSERRP